MVYWISRRRGGCRGGAWGAGTTVLGAVACCTGVRGVGGLPSGLLVLAGSSPYLSAYRMPRWPVVLTSGWFLRCACCRSPRWAGGLQMFPLLSVLLMCSGQMPWWGYGWDPVPCYSSYPAAPAKGRCGAGQTPFPFLLCGYIFPFFLLY